MLKNLLKAHLFTTRGATDHLILSHLWVSHKGIGSGYAGYLPGPPRAMVNACGLRAGKPTVVGSELAERHGSGEADGLKARVA